MSPQHQTAAEAAFWTAYDQLLAHSAACHGCRGPIDGAQSRTCPEGERLFQTHQAARKALRTETNA